jgi:hypothetical protein
MSCTGGTGAEAASPSCITDAKASLASADCDATRSKELREAQPEELASALKVCKKLEHSQSVGQPVRQARTHTLQAMRAGYSVALGTCGGHMRHTFAECILFASMEWNAAPLLDGDVWEHLQGIEPCMPGTCLLITPWLVGCLTVSPPILRSLACGCALGGILEMGQAQISCMAQPLPGPPRGRGQSILQDS